MTELTIDTTALSQKLQNLISKRMNQNQQNQEQTEQQNDQKQQQIVEKVEDIGLKYFYCEKCYDMVNYFIDECWSKSEQAIKYKDLLKQYKKQYVEYKQKFDDLDFEFEEVKAAKEEIEEKIKRLACSQHADNSDHDNNCDLSDNNGLIVPYNVSHINRQTRITTVSNSQTSVKLNFDLSYLKNKQNMQFFTIENLEKLFGDFARVFSQNCNTPSAIEYTESNKSTTTTTRTVSEHLIKSSGNNSYFCSTNHLFMITRISNAICT
jgi:hypothetical protein